MTHSVNTAGNLFDYFNLEVEAARTRRRLRISSDTSLYLATLLADRARTDRPGPHADTLAELYAVAASAPPAQQVRTYRELGDRALYLLGYFAESLSRRIVGPGYYADMGAAAYDRVDHLFKALFADAFGPVFRELARNFEGCATVISDVKQSQHQADDVLGIYELWLETGDEALAEKLRASGLLLPSGNAAEG